MTVEDAVEKLIATLQDFYRRPQGFTWPEVRPVMEQLFRDCLQECAPEKIKRLQDALGRWEYRAAIDGQTGAHWRWVDGAKN